MSDTRALPRTVRLDLPVRPCDGASVTGASSPQPGQEVPRAIAVGIALTIDPQLTRSLLEQFCLALSDATGIEVIPRGVSSYQRLLDDVSEGNVDIVWLPPIIAVRAAASGAVRPFALPLRAGTSSYTAALFTSRESHIRTLDDLDDLRAAWVDPESAAGYLLVRAHLAQQGIDLHRAFSENTFFGSHDAVADAVVNKRADVGATFAYLDEQGHPLRAGWGHASVRIIAKAGPIPNDLIAARTGLSDLLVRLVQSALIDVQNAELRQAARALLSADGFIVPQPDHLQPLERLLADIDANALPQSLHNPRGGSVHAPPSAAGPASQPPASPPTPHSAAPTSLQPPSSAAISGLPVSAPLPLSRTLVEDAAASSAGVVVDGARPKPATNTIVIERRPAAKTIVAEPLILAPPPPMMATGERRDKPADTTILSEPPAGSGPTLLSDGTDS